MVQFGQFYIDTWPKVIVLAVVGVVLVASTSRRRPVRGVKVTRSDRSCRVGCWPPTAPDERVVELEHSRSHAVEDAAGTLQRVERDHRTTGPRRRLVAMAMTLFGRAQDAWTQTRSARAD